MRKADMGKIITLILGGLAYSLMSFAYMHATFTSKDVLQIVLTKIESIDSKLDRLIEGGK